MSHRTLTVHAFCSVKGGVGKSTLAVVCARLLADMGRVPLLFDCDFIGTSLADALLLRAPRVALRHDGSMNLDAAPAGPHLTVAETRAARSTRDHGDIGLLPPPYLNDLLAREETSRLAGLTWQHEHEDGVLYLPSSSLQHDTLKSLNWFHGDPFDWLHRFAWLLDDFVQQLPALTDIVVDLPPGIWGFTHETLVLLSHLTLDAPLPEGFPTWRADEIRWRANPLLVTSADRNDLLPAIEYLWRHRRYIGTLQPLVNRSTEGIEAITDRALTLLGSTFRATGLEQTLRLVPESPTLARIFKEAHVPLDDAARRLVAALRLEATV